MIDLQQGAIKDLLGGRTIPEAIDFYQSRISALELDIDIFGPAGDDEKRLADYRSALEALQQTK